jgi:hypothetical protein
MIAAPFWEGSDGGKCVREGQDVKANSGSLGAGGAHELMLQLEMTIISSEGGDLASTERDERQVHAGVGYSAP